MYILTLMDYATYYPEADAFLSIETESIDTSGKLLKGRYT